MGRAFEYRKTRKFARWDKMSKAFTRIGKEISIAVKQGGPDPSNNPRLRSAIHNAKMANMPKDRIEAAIKRASSKDEKALEEIVYEGFGPHGVAFIVECATDNPNRTVANLRVLFNRGGGALGTSGSVEFLFSRKSVFRFPAEGINADELALELIDYGAEDVQLEDGQVTVITPFADFGKMLKALESKGINASSEIQRIPLVSKELTEQQADEVVELIEKIEEDDDVQAVFTNMA
jgi:YebC/PmpR family DNA-binding regulatory protein